MTTQTVRETVYVVLADLSHRATSEIGDDDELVADLSIDGDDLSFEMIPELERRFGRRTNLDDWNDVWTVRDVIRVFERPRNESL
jgi:acyl carrier protein